MPADGQNIRSVRAAVPYLVLFLAFTLLYTGSLSLGFLSDDFLDLHHTFGPGSFTRMEIGGFRPVTVAVYAFDAAVYGPTNPWGWHLTNVLLHLACAYLMYLFLRELGFDGAALFAGVALFALTAAGPPAVARMSGRTTVISILPILGAFVLHARWLKSHRARYLVFAQLLFLASLYAKETALLGPLVFVGISLYLREPSDRPTDVRGSLGDLLLYLIPVAFYLLWRAAFGILTVHYRESLTFGAFMVKNLVRLASMSWAPWIDSLPVRIQLLTLVPVLFLPLGRRVKILYLVMAVALLATVCNLPPRANYAYAGVPAASFLLAAVVTRLGERKVWVLLVPLLLGCALAARDGMSRIAQASSYVRGLTERIIELDGSLPGDGPVFLEGVEYDVAGYPTVWPGAYDLVMESAGHDPRRPVAESDVLWEIVHSVSPDFSGVSCWFVQLRGDVCVREAFSTDSRVWTGDRTGVELEFAEGRAYVDSSLHTFNSLAVPSRDTSALCLPDPWNGHEQVRVESCAISGDTTWFDLEGSVPWLLSDPPFGMELDGYGGTALLSPRRIWREELEERLRRKQAVGQAISGGPQRGDPAGPERASPAIG